jgi:hypothetical protein
MAQHNPHRRGIAKTITIDHDAVAILMELSGGKNCQGRFVSDLLRAERVRREEREKLRKVLQEALP